jgi:hypothetical protein
MNNANPIHRVELLVGVSTTRAKKSISFYFFEPPFVVGILCPLLFECAFKPFHYALLPRNKPNGEDPKAVAKEKEDKEEEMIGAHRVASRARWMSCD